MSETADIYGLHFGNKQYCYIGSSLDHQKRFKQHLGDLRGVRHCNYRLQIYCAQRNLDELQCELLAVVPVELRFVHEYQWIKDCSQHPLTNLIHSERQQRHVLRGKSIGAGLLRTAIKMLTFNRLIPTTPLWRDVINLRDEILEVAEMFNVSSEFVDEIRRVFTELQLPSQYA